MAIPLTLINQIQDKQEFCNCNRSTRVRFQCITDDCQYHKENIFFCEECLDELNEKKVGHFQVLITKILQRHRQNWMELAEKEGSLYNSIKQEFLKQRELLEYLESQEPCKSGLQGRLIAKDMEKFTQFNEEFKEVISEVQVHDSDGNVVKLHAFDPHYERLYKSLHNDFLYLHQLNEPDFVFDNYKACIEGCPIPPDNPVVREKLLQMKVQLGKQNIQSSQIQTQHQLIDLGEQVKSLRSMVNKHEAQLNAYNSLFGGLEGISPLVNLRYDYQNQKQINAREERKISSIDEQIKELEVSIKMLKQFQQSSKSQNLGDGNQLIETFKNQFEQQQNKSVAECAQNTKISEKYFLMSQFMLYDGLMKIDQLKEGENLYFQNLLAPQLIHYFKSHSFQWPFDEIYENFEIYWFEGLNRDKCGDLNEGIYFGEIEYGLRQGRGMLFTSYNGSALFYECWWENGEPTKGNYIDIYTGGEWEKNEGTMDEDYLLTGDGSWHGSNRGSYNGQFKAGQFQGQGKRIYVDGASYEGEWEEDKWHGQGRKTEVNGEYHIGEWEKGQEIGVHKYYSKAGVLIREEDHGEYHEEVEEEGQE